jgi:hypothetical protein
MIAEHELLERLRELADVTGPRRASADVERRLMEAFAVSALQRTASPGPTRWLPAMTMAMALFVATAALVWQTRLATGRGEQAFRTWVPLETRSLDGFVPVPGAASLPQLESGSVVRYELPVTTLRAYGLDIVPEPARPTVDAELLIGQDGYARAIRLTHATDTATQIDETGMQVPHD